MSQSPRISNSGSDNRDVAEVEAKLNQQFIEYAEKTQLQIREKDNHLQQKEEIIFTLQTQNKEEKEKLIKIENKLIIVEESLQKEKEQRIMNENQNAVLEEQVKEQIEQNGKLQKDNEEELRRRRKAEENQKLLNEEKEKILKKLENAEQLIEITQIQVADLEANMNSAKELGKLEMKSELISIQEKMRFNENALKRIQEEKHQSEEKSYLEIHQLEEELTQAKIKIETQNVKYNLIKNQYESDKKVWVENEQKEKKQEKEQNDDKQRADKYEALYNQEQQQRRKLETELLGEQEEKQKNIEQRKEMEQKYIQNEDERRKAEQQLRFGTEEKIEALKCAEYSEKCEKEEHEKRIKAENEANKLQWENERIKKENERKKQEVEIEKNLRLDFQARYLVEFEQKENEIKVRNQIELLQKKTHIEKQDLIRNASEAEKRINELDERLHSAQEEQRIMKDEVERMNAKVEREIIKAKEEERRRKEIEIEKQKIEMENWNLKRDYEKVKIASEKLKQEFGEEKANEEIQISVNLLKEQDDQIHKLKDELEIESSERKKNQEEILILRNAEEKRPKIIKSVLTASDPQHVYIQGELCIRPDNDTHNKCVITVDPVISEGIVYFEVVFFNHDDKIFHIGVTNVEQDAKDKKEVKYYSDGDSGNVDSFIFGNGKFISNQRVGAEINLQSNPRTLTFFVEGKEQPNSFIDISQSIRFFVYTIQKHSAFLITRFERLSVSQAKGLNNSRTWIFGSNYSDQILDMEYEGNDEQKKTIREMQEKVCQELVDKFDEKENVEGRKQTIESGITVKLLNILETRDLTSITKQYTNAMYIFTRPSNDEIVSLLIQKKDPFPGLIRTLQSQNEDVVKFSIVSIHNMLYYRGEGSDKTQQHPQSDALIASGGVEKIYALYKKNVSKFIKDRAIICFCFAYRAREITPPETQQDIITNLKVLVRDQDTWMKNASKRALKDLSKNECMRQQHDQSGIDYDRWIHYSRVRMMIKKNEQTE